MEAHEARSYEQVTNVRGVGGLFFNTSHDLHCVAGRVDQECSIVVGMIVGSRPWGAVIFAPGL